MVINAVDEEASIELRDPATGALFAACPVKRDGPPAVQKGTVYTDCMSVDRFSWSSRYIVVDSSRYFVLRVVDQKSGAECICIHWWWLLDGAVTGTASRPPRLHWHRVREPQRRVRLQRGHGRFH
jgi:hypothetical protein